MASLRYELLPASLAEGMRRYIEERIEPGSFLFAVLQNDLTEACAHADYGNRLRLFDLVSWLYNEAPRTCWGSPAKVEIWLGSGEPSDGT